MMLNVIVVKESSNKNQVTSRCTGSVQDGSSRDMAPRVKYVQSSQLNDSLLYPKHIHAFSASSA